MSKWFIYILQCENGNLYTGSTNDLVRRLKEHIAGRGAKYTKIFGARTILHSEEFDERITALRREREIKRFSKKKKLLLIKK